MTQTKHVTPAPGLEDLAQLAGKWHTEGELLDGPFGGAASVVGVDTYEWLEGGRFLIHRFEGRFAARPAACIEIFGREAEQLVGRSYYDDGKRREWTVIASGQELQLSGDGDEHPIRCELRCVEQGNALEATWSYRQAEGSDWRVFLKTRATKALPLPNTSVGG